jgi:hypothetical protein
MTCRWTHTVTVTRRALALVIALLAGVVWLDAAPVAAADHSVFAYGDAGFHGSTGNAKLNQPVVGMASTPSGDGYWLVSEEGRVFAFGDAEHLGSLSSTPPSPIIGIASTPNGDGYWLTSDNGSIYTFGAAPFLGGLGGVGLAKPIVGIAAAPSGVGYWLVASDGGIFTFGSARFLGSTGAIRLNQPITGMAATPSGNGYWLVARDGGIFTFGDARFLGSTGAIRLARSIVGMASTPGGGGYWLVAADGGLFTFGDARFHGSLGGGGLTEPAVGIVGAPTGSGYWIVTTGHLASSPTANPPQVMVHSGTYRVSALGPVFPGTYRAERATPTCTWERRAALSGDEAAVLGTRTSDDRQLVTIRSGDAVFRTSGCATFVNDVFPITQSLTGDIGDGTYVIGLDIAPGTWTAQGGTTDCIWERVSDFSGAPDALKATDSGVVNPTVEIQPGDAGFVTSDCGTWSLR